MDTNPLDKSTIPPTNWLRVLGGTVLGLGILIGGSVLFAMLDLLVLWVVICIVAVIAIILRLYFSYSKTFKGAIKSFAVTNDMRPLDPKTVLTIVPKSLKTSVLRNVVSSAYSAQFNGHNITIFDFLREELQPNRLGTSYGIVAVKTEKPLTPDHLRNLGSEASHIDVKTENNTVFFIVKGTSFYVKSNMDNVLKCLNLLFQNIDK